ncbi:MAG: glycosyltransferase 87 family protein [Actinomycetota bacterium]
MLATSALFLLAGYGLKAQCLAGFGGREFSHLCYNDIQPLYAIRGVAQQIFPYVDGRLAGAELLDGAIEYPVLTGVFMWASGLPVATSNSYLNLSAVLLAPFGVLVSWLLYRMTGLRALLWAAAPAIVLYAFHNWDLLAVAAAVGGLYLWWRDKPLGAAAAFGIGAALKMYPLMFLGPLALDLIWRKDLGRAIRAAATGVGAWLAINLPFMVANFDGWYATYAFHRRRLPNFDSIWQLGWPAWPPSRTNLVTTGLLLLSFALILGAGLLGRPRRSAPYPFLQTCAALLAAFLLFNKVHSPQYTLWLLPFFVVLRVHLGWWIAYALADLAVYVGVFRWFYDVVYQGLDFTWAKRLLIAGVWTRAALLLALVVVFLTARSALVPRSGESLSQTRSSLGPVGEQPDE